MILHIKKIEKICRHVYLCRQPCVRGQTGTVRRLCESGGKTWSGLRIIMHAFPYIHAEKAAETIPQLHENRIFTEKMPSGEENAEIRRHA